MNSAAASTFAASPATRTTNRPRVLVIAELANPDWVSVPLVGWSHWRALSRLVDGHLVTHARNRENILKAGEPAARITTIDTSQLDRMMWRLAHMLGSGSGGGQTTITALGTLPYYYFEHCLWRELGARIRAHEWDIVHRLTPLTPAAPSLIAAKCAEHGVPFVIGPLNGGLPWPKGFRHVLLQEREWLSYLREAYKLLPGYQQTRRFASAIIVGSSVARMQITRRYRHKTVYIPENAIDPARFQNQNLAPVTLPLKVVFVGRFAPLKGIDMLIESAAPLVRAGLVNLELIGDGQLAGPLREMAIKENLPDTIFAGWVDHGKLQDRLAAADILALPSIREFGGGVVLEGMALGLVPIVMNYGGPGELVSADTGFRIPMGSRAEIISAFRATLEGLAAAPSSIRAIGARARDRVLRLFTWDAKAAQVFEVYRWVLKERDMPDFGMPFPDRTPGPSVEQPALAGARS